MRRPETDYDLCGVVGVRVMDASPRDARALAAQLGRAPRRLDRDPDIVVKFVDEISLRGVRHVQWRQSGAAGGSFLLLNRGPRKKTAAIDLRMIGERCEVVCEHGIGKVPFLLELITLTAARHGWAAVHGSAFEFKGTGTLAAGWAKGGKTEALLAFARHGARFVGDDWVLVSNDGERMCGLTEHVGLWDWGLDASRTVRRRMGAFELALFRSVRALERLHQGLAHGPWSETALVKRIRRAMLRIRRIPGTRLRPTTVFGSGGRDARTTLDRILLMVTHDRHDIVVEPMDALGVAERMSVAGAFEELPLTAAGLAYRFALPDRSLSRLEELADARTKMLRRAFSTKEAYAVLHPYPCSLERLYHAIAPVLTASVRAPASRSREVA